MASSGFIELLRLADLAQARKTGRHNSSEDSWQGIVFEVAGQKLIAPLGEIAEVLATPTYTPMPLTKEWLLGIANVRGRLLPLMDLAKFLRIDAKNHIKHQKVMVVDQGETFVGLLVDQVLGIVRFASKHYIAQSMPQNSPFVRYNHGKFTKDDEDWFVFMPSLLVKDARFENAAA